MEFKDKGYHLPCVLDRHVFLATNLNFCRDPVTAILIYISYSERENKEKSQSAQAGINAFSKIQVIHSIEKNSGSSPVGSEEKISFQW